MAMKKKSPAIEARQGHSTGGDQPVRVGRKKAAAKKSGDLAGIGTPERTGRTAQRGIDQTNRRLKDPFPADTRLYNQIKYEQSKQDKGGRARTTGRFANQARKATRKLELKKMTKSSYIKQYQERRTGQ